MEAILKISRELFSEYKDILLWISLLFAIAKGIHWLYTFFQRHRLAKELDPYYTAGDVKEASQYYVETQCQDVAPSLKDEIRATAANRRPIIKFFIREAFRSKDKAKFYLVLGGSGTGKTTFMINLIRRYKARWIKRDYDIKLYPIKAESTFTEIKKIINAGRAAKTILLLDALDEDLKAARNFNDRMNEILQLVSPFKEIVITCRTQFIPNEDSIRGEIQIPIHGPQGGFHQLNTKYISPFNERDIRKYLRKRFPWYKLRQLGKRRQGKAIIKQSPDLMARPMLLSYCDLLIKKGPKHYDKKYKIYEVMVEEWLNREAARCVPLSP